MKRALLPLWFIGGIVCTTLVADAQSLEPASIRSDQAETHSVVVDVPRVISLPPASPETWEAWWAIVPSVDPLKEQPLTNEQVGSVSLARLHLVTSSGG
jgi:hypothetical protein